jgi:hypothetical protein
VWWLCCTRFHQKKTKAGKKKRLNFRSSIIIIITCRLAKGVCIILLALSIHQNIIHLVGALNVAFIIHPSIIMMSGLANTDSRQKLRKKGTKILITRFRFRRSSSSAAPGRRTQTPGPTSLPDLPPPGVTPLPTIPAKIGSRGCDESGTRRMEGVSIVKELVGSR